MFCINLNRDVLDVCWDRGDSTGTFWMVKGVTSLLLVHVFLNSNNDLISVVGRYLIFSRLVRFEMFKERSVTPVWCNLFH